MLHHHTKSININAFALFIQVKRLIEHKMSFPECPGQERSKTKLQLFTTIKQEQSCKIGRNANDLTLHDTHDKFKIMANFFVVKT